MPQLSQKIVVPVVYVAAVFMSILDSTVVNVTLPVIARRFDVQPEQGHAVVIGYLLSLAVFMPASGWLADRFGVKRVFLTALALFVVASGLCGLARSLPELVGFRIVQGAGGGLVVPVGMAMVLRAFPPIERPRATRLMNLATIIAPASGPVLGGLLTVQLSWRYVFLVNVPIGVLAFLFGLLFLTQKSDAVVRRFDVTGFLLSGCGFGAAVYALSEGPDRGWTQPDVIATGVLGFGLLIALVRVELRAAGPLLNLRLLGNRPFRTNSSLTVLTSASFLGILYLMPQFLQTVRGFDPLESGLTTFPEAVGVVITLQIIARVYPRIGPRRLQLTGLVALAVIVGCMALIGLDTPRWQIVVLMFLSGVSMGFVFMPTQTAAFASMPAEELGQASALYNVGRQLGSAAGVAGLSTVVAALGSDGDGPGLVAYRAGFFTAATVALLAAAVALTTRDADAAPTMKPRERVADRG
ncbi:DHA2 family efflux MFS transporter permease subunit [Kutzneria kofuensis]|uniref:EmrB/QacA subfamily drug resistance transporter n=1 Tax=Kutzneria kofuensis TaxID=103725 RepID=A0A7W9KAB8_9PSEU|nr:DHA2 family efflux MFS transporter permease subunit [Kutzneria kofuensis]MBB5888942.1 EmrB/QacA subfamily drug resistance transporter [Kutzneria kofuensis]